MAEERYGFELPGVLACKHEFYLSLGLSHGLASRGSRYYLNCCLLHEVQCFGLWKP